MNKSIAIRRELNATLREFGYKTNKVAVEIYGKLYYLTEVEIRGLQVMAKRAAEKSDESFKEFTENVIVYSSRYKSRAKHTMVFRKDGCFANDFEPGFEDMNDKLIFEIL